MRRLYDVIVVGAGSMGMAAGYQLARRGVKTLLIDAFDPPHGNGSHHGETRLIRHAYSGGPTYVNLALRADRLWTELEEESGEELLVRSGVLNISDPAVYRYEERFQDAANHGVAVESLNAAEMRKRWPGLRLPDSYQAMYEPNAGFLYSERCIAAYRKLALRAGAELVTNRVVTGIEPGDGIVAVATKEETFFASHVIVSAGAWFGAFASLIDLPIRAVRKVVGWFEPEDRSFDAGAFPGFTFGTTRGGYYGFPSIGGAGVKIGRHDGGVPWKLGEDPAPFGHYPEDEADLRQALSLLAPAAAGNLLRGGVCKYELTPDEDFILDVHPEHPNVLLAGGFSGHGFKFSSVVGELLANRIEQGEWGQDIRLFSTGRFTAGDPIKEATIQG
ncbi:N-methyl-L-tryptophan oxidase [Gorillibacterium massiliense]|uniref:N-methyl-L-tryptophan oxidase n=1 Tax=Gorillibacterium massiliense TaxID=1280390 RepID=UPI0004B45118|nr:N-methyl-L-tryptophan oxidase [Gorillibacterium massiliense]